MREVRVSTVNSRKAYNAQESMESVLERTCRNIRLAGRSCPDLVLLSEIFANYPAGNTKQAYLEAAQTLDGTVCSQMSELAVELKAYMAFGLLRKDGDRVFNSLILLDRSGQHVWTYDKTTPVVTETEDSGIIPGSPAVFDCDFGRIGGAICFDINYNEIAEIYMRKDVELVLFSSAFPAGRLLDSWSLRYGFAIAGSTWYDNNRIIDCTGTTVAHTSDILPYTTAVMNLNRRVVHMDFNLDKFEKMINKYGADVLVEDRRDEAVVVITSLKKGLEVADLIKEFDIELLHTYLDRSRRVRAENGGLGL